MKQGTHHSTEMQRNWHTITSLVSRDFKLKYRRSVLGVLWSVLNPLLMMVVLTAVFSSFFKFDIENFPLYLILGNTLFALMADSTTTAMNSIIDSAPLIKKIRINKMIFPIEKVLFTLVNYMLSLIAVAAVMIYFQIAPTLNLLYMPLLLVFMLLFSAGLGLLLSSLAVFFRDVIHLWSVFLTAWTYLTPMFYSIKILPEWLQTLESFNPMYLYLTYLRDALLFRVNPSLELTLGCAGFAVASLVIGYLVFRRHESKFILYI